MHQSQIKDIHNEKNIDHNPTAEGSLNEGQKLASLQQQVTSGKIDPAFVAENKVTVPDFHATILHLLGIDHEKLTFYHNGINRRLTDVHGKVIEGILT